MTGFSVLLDVTLACHLKLLGFNIWKLKKKKKHYFIYHLNVPSKISLCVYSNFNINYRKIYSGKITYSFEKNDIKAFQALQLIGSSCDERPGSNVFLPPGSSQGHLKCYRGGGVVVSLSLGQSQRLPSFLDADQDHWDFYNSARPTRC